MALGQFLQIASAVVALAGIAGLAVVRGSLTIARDQNKDLRQEVADIDRRHDETKVELVAAQVVIANLRADVASLQRIVTGEVQWQAISDLLDHHHKAAQEQWQRHEELLIEIRDLLGRRSE